MSQFFSHYCLLFRKPRYSVSQWNSTQLTAARSRKHSQQLKRQIDLQWKANGKMVTKIKKIKFQVCQDFAEKIFVIKISVKSA